MLNLLHYNLFRNYEGGDFNCRVLICIHRNLFFRNMHVICFLSLIFTYFLLEITFFYKTFLCAFRKGISTQEIQHKFKCNHKCEFKHFSKIQELLFIPNFEHLGPNCDYICTVKKVNFWRLWEIFFFFSVKRGSMHVL